MFFFFSEISKNVVISKLLSFTNLNFLYYEIPETKGGLPDVGFPFHPFVICALAGFRASAGRLAGAAVEPEKITNR